MANGGRYAKWLVYNLNERAVSSDQNREQYMHHQALIETMRHMIDPTSNFEFNSNGSETFGTGNETSLRGHIIDGVRFRPEIGTANAFIEPGIALVIDTPSPVGEQSKSSLVYDSGVQSVGLLVLTPGAGSTRIDVVECRRIDQVFETDNRDIYNPGTGIFTATTVPKVVGSVFEYRIRTGTPGAGFPGVVAGWMPIAVCSVPSVSTTWDNVTVWDVRPLIKDRWNAPHQSLRNSPALGRQLIRSDSTVGGQLRIAGFVDAQFEGYCAGGRLDIGVPGTRPGYVDIRSASNQESGAVVYVANKMWFLYLVFPYDLPRWVRYTDASSGSRVPGSVRGIPTASVKKPLFDGTSSLQIFPPLSTGLQSGVYTGRAFCIAAGRTDNSAIPSGINTDGDHASLYADDIPAVTETSQSAIETVWTLTTGDMFPDNARSIDLRLIVTFNTNEVAKFSASELFLVTDESGVNYYVMVVQGHRTVFTTIAGVQSWIISAGIRIPLTPVPNLPVARTFKVKWLHGIGGIASLSMTGGNLFVRGWNIGP